MDICHNLWTSIPTKYRYIFLKKKNTNIYKHTYTHTHAHTHARTHAHTKRERKGGYKGKKEEWRHL